MSDPQPLGPSLVKPWNLIWADYFNEHELNTDKWTLPSWKVQNMTADPTNVQVVDSLLTLTLKSASSGALVRSTFKFVPGMVAEARVRIAGSDVGDQVFNWPAWWTAGFRYPDSGEHDIVEGMKRGLKVSYWDGSRRLGFSSYPAGDWNNAYHKFTLYRRVADARVYWDGQRVGAYDTNDDGGPQALIFSLGSTPDETPVLGLPSRMFVDNVRVWSR